MTEKTLKQRLFWGILVGLIVLYGIGRGIEKVGQYSLLERNDIKFGSYGFYLAQIPEYQEGDAGKNIVLLGNSVYQYCGVPKAMTKLANKKDLDFTFFNMGQTAASVYDNLLQSAKIVNKKPDLVVISLIHESFAGDPKFKTDAHQMAFDLNVIKHIPRSFYQRYFTLNTGASALLSSLFSIKKLDSILRWEINIRDRLPKWFFKKISYPHLNVLNERKFRGDIFRFFQRPKGAQLDFAEKQAVFQELVAVYRKTKTPVLFILQERQTGDGDEIKDLIVNSIKNESSMYFVDLRHYWSKDKYRDSFHPHDDEVLNYAARHLNEVIKVINISENKGK